MGRTRIFIVLAIAAVGAIGLAWIVGAMTKHKNAPAPMVAAAPAQPMARVLVAKHDLGVGTNLGPNDLVWQDWPASAVNPAFITDGQGARVAPTSATAALAARANQTVRAAASVVSGGDQPMQQLYGSIVRQPILANEPVTSAKVVRGGAGGYMAVVLRPGMRAYSLPVTVNTAAGGFILPGDRVDVVTTHPADVAANGGHPGFDAQTILHNIRVLAIDQNSQPPKGGQQSDVGGTATLEIAATDVDVLARAKAQGDVMLALRPYSDANDRAGVSADAAVRGQVRIFRPGEETQVMVVQMKPRTRPLLAIALLLIASLAGTAIPAQAQTAAPIAPMRVDLATASSQTISLPRGKSAIIDLPVDARDVLVTNPAVADAVLRTPRRIYVMGLAPGATDAAFFDATGRRILALNIRVDQDFSAVAQTINRLMPDSHVQVESVNASLVLSGQVASLTEADEAVQIAQQFTANPQQVVNMLSIADKQQVMLKVRMVEMQRSVIKQLGFNLSAVVGQVGSPQWILGTAATFGVNGALLGGLTGGYQLNTTQQPEVFPVNPSTGALLQVPTVCGGCNNGGQASIATPQTTIGSSGINKANTSIEAFEQVGLVRTLAEPNLTAVSGESAKFLAGGEFPVPSSVATNGQVGVEFKTFGIGLGFTPIVLSGGRISLKISTEVSELSNQGSFTLSTGTNTAGLTIPGLTVRRAETTVEMPSGGSMMIAGLLSEETKQNLASLPGLMNLPVLGALFNSRDYQEGETELVVIVTPYLVSPTSPSNLQTPADGFQVANDSETVLLGRLNKVYKAPPAAVAGKTYQGPVGYVID